MRHIVISLCWACIAIWPLPAQAQYVRTLAGTGAAGLVDGALLASQFSRPVAVVVDSGGDVLVVDSWNHAIRRVRTGARSVVTVAGSGIAGYVDAGGTVARFYAPGGAARDSLGNLYVADTFNHVIRKVTAIGNVTTFAGSGAAGFADGAGTAASFNYPLDVTVDGFDNLYVADADNHRIRKITPAGVVTTLTGTGVAGDVDGAAGVAQLTSPGGIDWDRAANVLVISDTGNHRVKRITMAGVVTTIAGNGVAALVNGAGVVSSFNTPRGLAVDPAGNIFIADASNHVVRLLTRSGGAWTVSTYAGTGIAGYTDGRATVAQFNGLWDVDVSGGIVFVADYSNNVIREIRPLLEVDGPFDFAGGIVGGFVDLRWRAPAGAEVREYVLEVGTAPGASDVLVMSLGLATQLNAPAPTATLYLRMRAALDDGVTRPSVEIVLNDRSGAPGTPSNLAASVAANRSVTLTWSPPAGGAPVASYLVHAGTVPGETSIASLTVGNVLTLTVPNAPPGRYFVHVHAVGTNGAWSAASNAIVVNVP